MKLRNPINSTLNTSKLTALYRRIRERLGTKAGQSIDDAVEHLHVLFKQFFTTLGKPTLIHRPLIKGDDPKPSQYNKMMQEIKQDLDTAFEEAKLAASLVVETFNISQIQAEELNVRSNQAASKIVDLRLLNGQLDQEVIIAGDDFTDLSRVDSSFPRQGTSADVRTDEGIVTLNRVQSINVINPNVRVRITPILPVGAKSTPTTDNTLRFYEGNFYDYIGAARPEGGRYHLEEQVDPSIRHLLKSDSAIIEHNLASQSIFDDAVDQRNDVPVGGGTAPPPTDGDRTAGLPLREEDILVIDRGASINEKNFVRQRMLDGDPGTFWECEYVVHAQRIQDFVDDLTAEGQVRSTTPQQLRAQAVLQDESQNKDLEIQLTIELIQETPVNWISLVPINFGETTWIDVTEVSTALDDQSGFVPIEGFDLNRFANVLTNEANEEVSSELVLDTLAPSRFSFRGTGVWSFPVREAKFIRIRLKQRVPVPNPYQRMAVQLNRTISKSESYQRSSGGGKK